MPVTKPISNADPVDVLRRLLNTPPQPQPSVVVKQARKETGQAAPAKTPLKRRLRKSFDK